MKSEQMHLLSPKQYRRWRIWLWACMIAVIGMVALGGITRLTESGLSIVEWKVLSGTLPPLSPEAWQAEFSQYQTSPEFLQKNHYFTLSDFKHIYWLEYSHRLLGRMTGMVFLLPMLFFAFTKKLPKPHLKRMFGISALVGMQGAMGWVMVQSGLIDLPRVHPVNLALHLSLAALIFSGLLISYWQSNSPPAAPPAAPPGSATNTPYRTLCFGAKGLLVLFIIQLILGAFVAATDAGLSYNSYPLMNGQLIPDGLGTLSPWWRNFTENITSIQFAHRMGAALLLLSCIGYIIYVKAYAHGLCSAINALIIAMSLQFMLGVFTLLSHVAIALASAHQLVAFALLGAILRLVFLAHAACKRARMAPAICALKADAK
jgi:cytochrome c oxidase assembly protein subunit 15